MTDKQPNEGSIFLRAIEISSADARAAYLDEACAGNDSLRAGVEALLTQHEKPQGLLDAPDALGETVGQSVAETPGDQIGPYKLMEQIGEGGMGLVFVAEQQRPVRRKVALKVIKPGMDSRDVIARFEAERQALALMDHPHIARVFDAGTTESGRPYFVMELVRGVPITEYCDQNNLAPRERLELFAGVCQAVQHAHTKGIIHRDLKPSNVLVTLHDGEPVIKVIDFGVAKAIGQQLTDKTIYTRFVQMVGTPLYMSPEQAGMSALDVDTRSDIYSLGVMLYELLTGTTPFDRARLQTAAFDEIRRIIREEEPPKPSTRLSTLGATLSAVSARRKMEPRKLSALVRGDLDWIVMKALDKDRLRRYETASAFATDVRRFLNEQPVEARPPSVLYRVRKYARRNRVAVFLALFVAATLAAVLFNHLAGLVRIRAQRDRAVAAERIAERRLTEVTELAEREKTAREAAESAENKLHAALDDARRETQQSNSLRLAAQATAVLPENPGRALLLAIAAAERAPDRGIPHDQALLQALDECREERTLFAPPIAGEGARRGRTGFYTAHLASDAKRLVVGALRFSDPSELMWDRPRQQSGYVYDLATGNVTATLELPGMPFFLSDLSPDGKLLATTIHYPIICKYADDHWHACTDRVVRLFDTNTGKEARVFRGHEDHIVSLGFSSDGRRLMAASWDATVRVWDVKTGEELLVIRSPEEKVYDKPPFPDTPLNWRASFLFAQINADGSRLLTIDAGESRRHAKDLREHGFSGVIDFDKLIIDPPLPGGKPVWMTTGGWGGAGATWRGSLVRLWNARSGELVATFPNEGGWGGGHRAAFTPDGKCLVTSLFSQTRLWDAQDGKQLAESPKPGGGVWRELTHEGSQFIVVEDAPTLVVWQKSHCEGSEWTWSRKFVQMRDHSGTSDGRPVVLAAGQARGRPLVALAEGKDVVVKEIVADTRLPRTPEATPVGVSMLAVLKGHDEPVTGAEFLPGGEQLVTVSIDGTIRTWSLAPPREHVLEFREPKLGWARFAPGGRLLTAGNIDQFWQSDSDHVSLWDIATKEKIAFDRAGDKEPNSVDQARFGPLTDLDMNPQGDRLVTVHRDRNPRDQVNAPPALSPLFTPVRVWDARSGKLLFALEGFTRSVLAARFSPDGGRLVTFADGSHYYVDLRDGKPFGSGGGGVLSARVDLWNAETGAPLRTLVGEKERTGGDFALWSPDGRRIFTNARPGEEPPRFLDAETGETVGALQTNVNGFDHAAYDPTGRHLLTGRLRYYEEREVVLLWNAETGTLAAKLAGHRGDVTFATFSADGGTLLTTSSDQTARLWHVPGGEERLVIHGHEGRINHGAFSADGRYVATASADSTARVWDAGSGEVKYVIHAPQRAKMLSVEFSPDGTQLLTVSSDNAARLWTLDLLPLARRHAPRTLTDAERMHYQLP